MADTNVRTFDPSQYVITFNGVPLTGFAEGTMCTLEREGDLFKRSIGSDGGVDRVKQNNQSFNFTAHLKATSVSNQILSAVLLVDQTTNGGTGVLAIVDLKGTTAFLAPTAWISKEPKCDVGTTMPTREWVFQTGMAVMNVGSN